MQTQYNITNENIISTWGIVFLIIVLLLLLLQVMFRNFDNSIIIVTIPNCLEFIVYCSLGLFDLKPAMNVYKTNLTIQNTSVKI